MDTVTLDQIRQAAARIRGLAHVTPVVDTGDAARPGRPLWLKCENLQRSGAFKIRGAANMLRQLPADVLARGVVTYSSGNHGLALAMAAQAVGCPAVVVMPVNAPPVKVEGTRRLGAHVVFEGTTTLERQARAEAEAAARGLAVVPPFDHPWIVAGQGTIGLEVLEQLPGLTAILIPTSGGGLLAGVATAVKRLAPAVRVVGVEPAVTPRMTRSFHAGAPVTVPGAASIADGLLAVRPGMLTWAHIAVDVDEIVTVTDPQVADAVHWLCDRAKLVAEPSGAATTAAALMPAPTTWSRDGRTFRDGAGPVAAIITGGNVDATAFAAYVTRTPDPGVGHG